MADARTADETTEARSDGEGGGMQMSPPAEGACASAGSDTPPFRAVRQLGAALGRALRRRGEEGMATAEYAIATVAAAGFAGLLVAILRSPEVKALLFGIVRGALSV